MVKSKRLSIALLAILLALLVSVPVSAAVSYRASVATVESNGTDYTMLPIITSVDSTYLAANGFITASALDTRIETLGGTEFPWLVADDKVLFATAIPADSQTNLFFTTANTAATSMDIIPGYNGYVTVADVSSASWELGNNFSIDVMGYVDTSAGATKNIVNKASAFTLSVSAVNTITATMLASSLTLAPNGAGDETNIPTLFGAATNWQSQLTNDGDTSYVEQPNNAWVRDLYAATDVGVGSSTITSVVVHWVAKYTGVDSHGMSAIKTHGVVYNGADTGLTAAYVDRSTTYATNPNTGVAWTWAEVSDMQIGVSLTDNGGNEARCTQVYAVVNYGDTVASVAGITSGVRRVVVAADGANLVLTVYDSDGITALGTNSVAQGSASVPDNGNNWLIDQTNVMPYMDYYKHTVGGLFVGHFAPVGIIRGAVYSAGTVTVTNGDATVEGAGGAAWTQAMVGSIFVSADTAQYVVASITDADTLELATVYGGGTLAGQVYGMYVRLPDREGTAQDGRITWGANPARIAVTNGAMVSTSQSVPGALTTRPTKDVSGEAGGSTWNAEPAVAGALLTHPFRPIIVFVSDNTTLTESQVWLWSGIVFMFMVLTLSMRYLGSHRLMVGIALAVSIIALVVQSVFPIWAVAIAVLAVVAGIIAERKQQL